MEFRSWDFTRRCLLSVDDCDLCQCYVNVACNIHSLLSVGNTLWLSPAVLVARCKYIYRQVSTLAPSNTSTRHWLTVPRLVNTVLSHLQRLFTSHCILLTFVLWVRPAWCQPDTYYWLSDWPIDWLIDWFDLIDFIWLIEWLIEWLTYWLIDWLIDLIWLIWFDLIDWLIYWLIDWLIDLFIYLFFD